MQTVFGTETDFVVYYRDGLRQIVDKLSSGGDIQQSRVRQEYSSFSGQAASQATGGVGKIIWPPFLSMYCA